MSHYCAHRCTILAKFCDWADCMCRRQAATGIRKGIETLQHEALNEFWIQSDRIPCVMKDGKIAILIRGPSEVDPKFGFQVPGEPDIRWREARQIERRGNVLSEVDG